MAKRYKFIRVPENVYLKLYNAKKELKQEVSSWSGKDIKLSMPKYLEALQEKNNVLIKLIPFNKKEVYHFIKRK